MIFVIATITIKPETRAQMLAGARDVIAGTLKEPGCLSYDLHQSITAPDTYVFVERWETRENLDAHTHTVHFKTWRGIAADCILTRNIEVITPQSVGGL